MLASFRAGAPALQGWGKCQKPSGQVDRCVFSICLAPGAWQMGRGDQAAENLDQFQTAPLPGLEQSISGAQPRSQSPRVLPARGSCTRTLHKAWLCWLRGLCVGVSIPWLMESLISAPALAALHFTFGAIRHLITLRYAHLPDRTVRREAHLT